MQLLNGVRIHNFDTGTRLKYKPGFVVCGSRIEHDCGTSRGIGYFLEPLVLLSLFAKKVVICGVNIVE